MTDTISLRYVTPTVEQVPLARVQEAIPDMMAGKASFRLVLDGH